MISLTWGQVNAWRLSQQYLTNRLPAGGLIAAVSQVIGVHAQVMSAAELAAAARVDDLSSRDVQAALWQERTLVKTWLMRQTLHLVAAADFPTIIAARRMTDIHWLSIFERQGVDRVTLESYLAAAPEILDNGPLTRQQFIDALSMHLKSPQLTAFLTSGSWSQVYKPLAWRGELCFGPNEGSSTTFIRPRAWLGGWQEPDPRAAMQEIVRRYLLVYGPSRIRNFQVWWWMSGVAARNAFKSIAEETEEVNVEGWRATALKTSIPYMQEMEPTGLVHLLPAFDVYTVGLARGKDLERLLVLEHQKKVYRPQGWVSAVVLVDGFIKGTWEHKDQRSSTSVLVNLFSAVPGKIKEAIAAEAERLGKFLNTHIELEFTPS